MRSVSRSFVLALGFAMVSATATFAGCGSDSSSSAGPDASVPVTPGTLRGALVGPSGESGVLDLTIPASTSGASARAHILSPTSVTVTGTLRLNSPTFGPLALSGTVDLSSGAIDFSAMVAGYTFHGTLANGVFSGTYTGPLGMGTVALTYDQLGGLRVFCGSFKGLAGPQHGLLNVFAVGTTLGVVYAYTPGAQGFSLGTADHLNVHFPWPPSGMANGVIDATGVLTGSFNDGAGLNGSISASEAACSAYGMIGSDGGSSDGAPNEGGTTSDASDAETGGQDSGMCTDPDLQPLGTQTIQELAGSPPSETGGTIGPGDYALQGNITNYGTAVSGTTASISIRIKTVGSVTTFQRIEDWFGGTFTDPPRNQTLVASGTSFTLSGGCPGDMKVVQYTSTPNGAGQGKYLLEILWTSANAPGSTFREIYFQR